MIITSGRRSPRRPSRSRSAATHRFLMLARIGNLLQSPAGSRSSFDKLERGKHLAEVREVTRENGLDLDRWTGVEVPGPGRR